MNIEDHNINIYSTINKEKSGMITKGELGI